jgi:transcriptional regulator with XRE-family HTH domain
MLRESKVVGQIIKLEREKRKLTQKDLAEILNVSYQAISKWENGDGYPDLEKLVAISDLYHMTIDQLIVKTKDGYNPILEHQINQTINNTKLSISIEDFRILNDETIITLHLKNQTDQDIELFPYRFHLTGKHKKYIEPIKEDFPLTKKGNNETDNVERKFKHEIPKQLKAKEEIWVNLFYKDCSSYPEIYLHPKIIKDFSKEYFKISKAMYYGIDQIITSPINMTKKYSMDDFKLIVEILISKGLSKELKDFLTFQKQKINRFFVVNFGCSFLKNNIHLFETRIDSSAVEFIFQKRIFISSEFIFKYGKTDNHIRETIKGNLNEFEEQCRDDNEFM